MYDFIQLCVHLINNVKCKIEWMLTLYAPHVYIYYRAILAEVLKTYR